jgi:penicillin-binding protein A
MSSPYIDSPDQDKLRTLSKTVLVLFMIVALALFFWGVLRAGTILTRSDNPRLIEEELRIRRGSILDRDGNVLATSEGTPVRQRRIYPLGNIGPAVGFYSVIHGTAGAESAFDDILRNDPPSDWQAFWQKSLHLLQEGRNVKLALDAELQLAAITALDQHHGAALLLEQDANDSNRVWVRALVSYPGYDANLLDQQFDTLRSNNDAPLLNRVTQGQYQPGLLLQPFMLASSLEQGLLSLNDPVLDPNRPVEVNGEQLHCASSPPDPALWVDALQHRCPGPMMDLADQLGVGGLDVVFAAFGLDRDPLLELDTTTTPEEPLRDPLLAGIGQENLSITPLQIGLAMSALANDGKLPQAQIGFETQDVGRNWQPWTINALAKQATTSEAAAIILHALPQENSIYEHSLLVLSGPNKITNAWYTGIMEFADSNFIAVVVLEGDKDEKEAISVGRNMLSAVRNNEH